MARQQTVMISLSVPETGQIAQQKLDIITPGHQRSRIWVISVLPSLAGRPALPGPRHSHTSTLMPKVLR